MDKNYTNPPIVEAVIEIRFSESITTKMIEKAKNKFLKEYPFCEELKNVGVHIDPSRQSSIYQEKSIGYKMTKELSDVLLVAENVFAISRLVPYQGWDALIKRTKKDWKNWKNIIKFQKIQRIGVRYINRIDIPIKNNEKIKVRDYINFYPYLPDNEVDSIAQYIVQITQPIEDNLILVMNSAEVPSPLLNHKSFILDIDISKSSEVPQKDEEIWSLLDKIRIKKDQIFEKFTSVKAKKLFDY